MSATRFVSVAALVVVSVAVAPRALAAQAAVPLTAGTRIRVRLKATPSNPLVGILDTISGDTIRLRAEGEREARGVALNTIEGIDVSRGRHSNAAKGALYGGAIMGGLDLIAGLALTSDQTFLHTSAGDVVVLTVAGAAFGAGVGALIGSTSHAEKWEALPPTSLRLAPVSLNRVGIMVSVPF